MDDLFNKILNDKTAKLKELIDNEEEFDLTINLIKNKLVNKFRWKLFYNEQDIFEVADSYFTEEILKRKQLKEI